ncbi:hypothetical protein BZU93_28580, partial [Salmonella enterica subsp. enterica]|nr:hypothetical protein [Salmonella enterica subsp. enterica serovar Enteritidis]
MNSSPAGYRDLLGALAAGADRLVDPAVPAGERRERMGRLALSIFIGSFVLSAAMALALPGVAGPAAMLAAISATLSVSWLAALSVAKAKAEPFAAIGMLAAAALALGGLVAVSGGGVSPLALLMAGLVAEPLWVYRGRKAGWAGCAALAASIAAASFLTIDSAGAQPWFWAPVLAYGASLGLRLAGLQPARASDNAPAFPYVGEAAIALRFSADGEIEDVPAAAPSGFEIDPVLLLGGGLLERVHVADRVQYMCALADIRSSAAPVRAEIRLRMPLAAGEPTSAVRYGLFELHAAGREQAVLRQVEETGRLREKLAEA